MLIGMVGAGALVIAAGWLAAQGVAVGLLAAAGAGMLILSML